MTQPADPGDTHVPSGADYVSDRTFADFPISAALLQGIHAHGYVTATPVQERCIEPVLAGVDMLVRAKTGTGKTAAFTVPILERIDDGETVPRAIVLAPTRELAQQIHDEAVALGAFRKVGSVVLVGGVAMGPQEQALAEGVGLVVGTPGRILDHYRRGNLDLSGIRIVCLDEADEMLSMGFYEDVIAILEATPGSRQILLFSATISADTQRIVDRYLKDPEDVRLSTDADKVEGIDHILYETQPGFHKARALLYLLDIEDPTSAIIFCNTREDAATVASYLDRQGLDVQLLSGELPQGQRNRVMARVKRGEVRFLTATDVAARGIDISDLSHVINYSLPQDPSVYLHRTGRTGRIGKQGTAISLVGGADMGTRKSLETRFQIPFIKKELPDAETCVRMRVDRQAARIRDAMGTMVFEAYLPTARALREREDGDALVAAALRAFFQWDRTRRADISDVDSVSALVEARNEKVERKKKKRDDRGERGDRGVRGDRGGRKRDRDRGGRSDDRGARSDDRGARSEDLDALLVADEGGTNANASANASAPGDADAGSADAGRKKKRRRKKKTGGGGGAPGGRPEGATTESGHFDDLDAMLSTD